MIEVQISINLPAPWSEGTFEADLVGPINYLVGPNGSGKSRFARELFTYFTNQTSERVRLLSTDRLREMASPGGLRALVSDRFEVGYAKTDFERLRAAGEEGSGIDAIPLLEERLDLRIRIEATLSHLFRRDVVLEWDSGNLVPKAVRRQSGESYRLDRDECHGIKELFVLLTHLYDDRYDYLIVDEPELNLHPQYQAFFMQEVRKIVRRKSATEKTKIVFLITHSPFILDLRSDNDLKSVISFDLEYSVPRQVARENPDRASALVATGRLNAHHKQLFFSDDPVFVEGHYDSMMIEALMEARGVSAAAAGSCIIDCGGMEEVTHYLELCKSLGKKAHFVYDLDSLFTGRLRQCIGNDNSIQKLLAFAGVGDDFIKYLGELDRLLTTLIDTVLDQLPNGDLGSLVDSWAQFGLDRPEWDKQQLAKARVAVMITIDVNRTAVASEGLQATVANIEGRWQQILKTLADKNIHVLPGGTIERYLPSFSGDLFAPSPEAKRVAVQAELGELQRIIHQTDDSSRDSVLADRYGALYEVIHKLPSKVQVDFDGVLRNHLSDYVHELQKVVVGNPDWECDQIYKSMLNHPLQKSGVVQIDRFQRGANGHFEATIGVSEKVGSSRRCLEVNSDTTIGNMGEFRGVDQGGTT